MPRCEPEPNGGTRHQVVLESTPFYPEGGGQPSDIGTLQISGSSELVRFIRPGHSKTFDTGTPRQSLRRLCVEGGVAFKLTSWGFGRAHF